MQPTDFNDHLTGEWTGTKLLYLSWLPDPERSSPSTLSIAPVAKGGFLAFTYTWIYEGAPQEGLLLLGHQAGGGVATASWVDSWHMSKKILTCTGTIDESGSVVLLGSYEAPPDPDWGWRITVTAVSKAELKIVMHNISPDGKEELAVQADFTRAT